MAFARRTDATHAAIASALRRCGWRVKDTSRLGDGFPDAVGYKAGVLRLFEFKTEDGAPTPKQVQFMAEFPVTILRSVEDVIQMETGR